MKFHWLRNFGTWVAIFFLIRLYGIWHPPLETWHSWRQTLTAMMSRNMSEDTFNLLYPRIDMGGDRSGILGSEFPLFQSITASLNTVFGYQHWYGRLISLIVASIGIYIFYMIVKRLWNDRIAKFAGAFLLASLWFAFSRKIMPDTFAVSLVLIGFWWMIRYVDTKRLIYWISAILMLALGGLSKIPATYLFICLIPFIIDRRFELRVRLMTLLGTGLASLIVGWWYFIWVPHLVNTYHFQLFFPKTITEGLSEIRPYWGDFWKQIYFGGLRSYMVLVFITLGLYFLFKGKRGLSIGIFASIGLFLLFAIKTGTVFPTHNYYVLPLVPVLALIAGIGVSMLPRNWAIAAVVLICVEALANQVSDFRIKDEVLYKLTIADQVDQALKKSEKVVVCTGPDPQLTYWLNRKTWSVEPNEVLNEEMKIRFKNAGFQFIVLDRHVDQALGNLKPEFTTSDCWIYRIP